MDGWMGWDGMGWDGMGRDGMGWGEVEVEVEDRDYDNKVYG